MMLGTYRYDPSLPKGGLCLPPLWKLPVDDDIDGGDKDVAVILRPGSLSHAGVDTTRWGFTAIGVEQEVTVVGIPDQRSTTIVC